MLQTAVTGLGREVDDLETDNANQDTRLNLMQADISDNSNDIEGQFDELSRARRRLPVVHCRRQRNAKHFLSACMSKPWRVSHQWSQHHNPNPRKFTFMKQTVPGWGSAPPNSSLMLYVVFSTDFFCLDCVADLTATVDTVADTTAGLVIQMSGLQEDVLGLEDRVVDLEAGNGGGGGNTTGIACFPSLIQWTTHAEHHKLCLKFQATKKGRYYWEILARVLNERERFRCQKLQPGENNRSFLLLFAQTWRTEWRSLKWKPHN